MLSYDNQVIYRNLSKNQLIKFAIKMASNYLSVFANVGFFLEIDVDFAKSIQEVSRFSFSVKNDPSERWLL